MKQKPIINRIPLIGLQIGAIVALCLGIFFDNLWLSGFSFAILLVYLGYAWRVVSLQPESAAQHSDNVYFLGYLLTIIGVGGIAYRVGMNPSIIDQPQPLILRAAFALASTIAGLLGMMTMRNFFLTPIVGTGVARDQVQHHMSNLADEMRKFLTAMQTAREEGIRTLNEQMKKIDFAAAARKFDESLGQSASNFATALAESDSSVRSLADEINAITDGIPGMVSSLNTLKTKIEELVRLFDEKRIALGNVVESASSIQKLTPSLKFASETLGAIGDHAKKSEKGVNDLSTCITDLQAALSEFVAFTKNSLGKGLHGVPSRFGTPNEFGGRPVEAPAITTRSTRDERAPGSNASPVSPA